MSELLKLPNIGNTLDKKLNQVGISSLAELKNIGSENVIIKIATIENSGVCFNMLCAIEGAIQGIRWYNLDAGKKQELKYFFSMLEKETNKSI